MHSPRLVVGFALAEKEEVQSSAATGFCESPRGGSFLAKPINRAQLIQSVAAYAGREPFQSEELPPPSATVDGDGPVVSLFVDDPDVAGILGEFVARLTEHVDAMRHAHASGQYEELQRYAHQLKGAGGCYGYPSLTDACKLLEDAAKARDHAAAGAAVDAVAVLCQAIQDGYHAIALAGRTQ